MLSNEHRHASEILAATEPGGLSPRPAPPEPPRDASPRSTHAALEVAVDYILDDCFFSIGQGVGLQKTIEHAALMWWRGHYRVKFLRTMDRFGNTWLSDRARVLSMCRMLGERAVESAGDRPSIDVQTAAKASAAVEQFCVKHALRRQRRLGVPVERNGPEMFAGYWCAL